LNKTKKAAPSGSFFLSFSPEQGHYGREPAGQLLKGEEGDFPLPLSIPITPRLRRAGR